MCVLFRAVLLALMVLSSSTAPATEESARKGEETGSAQASSSCVFSWTGKCLNFHVNMSAPDPETSNHALHLVSAEREGKHLDADELKAAQRVHRKMAECLKFNVLSQFSYDGTAEFCLEKKEKEEEA